MDAITPPTDMTKEEKLAWVYDEIRGLARILMEHPEDLKARICLDAMSRMAAGLEGKLKEDSLYENSLRGTGRTYRMCQYALEQAATGRTVHIGVFSSGVEWIEGILDSLDGEWRRYEIQVSDPRKWGKLRWRDEFPVNKATPDHLYLLDHYFLEVTTKSRLRHMHMWDQKKDGVSQ